MARMGRWFASAIALCLGLSVVAVEAAIGQVPEEGVQVRELPAIGSHWVFVLSPASLDAEEATKVTVIDGDSFQVLGMLTGGLMATFAIAPDHHHLYMADTFYSRGSRGERTDVVTQYDARKLAEAGEVILPPKRQLHFPPDSSALAVTADSRFLLVANLTPATSVTVVDPAARKVVSEIETTGCTEVLLSGSRQFSTLCGDGAMLNVQFDDQGKATHRARTAAPFFNPEKDPAFGVPAVIGDQAFFISYHGMVYPVSWSQNPPKPEKPWSLVSDAERQQNWRPGGLQPLASQAGNGRLYVLMHQGGEWTHKQHGTEVWVFDANQRRRVDRIVLPRRGSSIYVSQDAASRLFVLATPRASELATASAPSLTVFSATSGRYLGAVEQVPGFPTWIFGL